MILTSVAVLCHKGHRRIIHPFLQMQEVRYVSNGNRGNRYSLAAMPFVRPRNVFGRCAVAGEKARPRESAARKLPSLATT